MKLLTPNKWLLSTITLCTKHGYNYDEYEFAVAWYDENKKLIGYVLANPNRHTYTIDWIWARSGFGSPLLKVVERRLLKDRPQIELLVNIDSRERKPTVLRRMNFFYQKQLQSQKCPLRPNRCRVDYV